MIKHQFSTLISLIIFTLCILLPVTFAYIEPSDETVVTKIEWSLDGSQVAYGMSDGIITIWDVNQNVQLAQLSGHTDQISSLSWHQDIQQIASGSLDGTVRLWDLSNGKAIYVLDQYKDFITQILWIDDNTKIAVYYFANFPFATIHDAVTGEEVGREEELGSPLDSQYNPVDNTYAISGYGGNVWIADATDLSIINKFLVPTPMANNLEITWNSDYTLLAIGDSNANVSIRDVMHNEWIYTFKLSKQDDIDVRALAFDGDQLLGIGADGTLRSWNAQTGEVLVDERLGEAISSAAFNIETMQLAIAGFNTLLPQPNTTNGTDAQDTLSISGSTDVQILDLNEYFKIENQH